MKYYQDREEDAPGPMWLKGAIAGCIATIPMTIFMLTTQRLLPKGQRYDLPPEIIVKELAHRAHVRYRMNKQTVLAATLVSHFGYGTAMGMLYGFLEKKIPFVVIVRGVLFGLLVWAGSYLGLLPLFGMSESGHREPATRNLMMIVAHVIWGSTLGLATEAPLRR